MGTGENLAGCRWAMPFRRMRWKSAVTARCLYLGSHLVPTRITPGVNKQVIECLPCHPFDLLIIVLGNLQFADE
jgi:hypothetical protein